MMRLLEGHSLTTRALIEPESMGLTLTERDSSATPAFGPDAPALQVNDWMQDLEEPGAGIVWRVKTIDRQYDTGTVSCSLEHLIQSLGDRVLGEVKTKDIAGGSTCTARQAVEYILAHQSDWALGDFAFDGVSNPYHFNGETLKAALEKVTGSLQDPVWEYDFTVYPFLLHIRQQDQTVSSEMRAGRNLTSFKYTIDKTRMFTRFYPIGKNNKKPSPEYVSKNEGVYGRVDKKETDQSKATAAELIAWANERLSRHAEPLVTVTISGLDLSESTGESLDKLTVCHLCRVPLPEYGTTILEKVTKLVWRDKIKDRESVAVTLANALADVQSIIKEEKARGGGAARTAAKLNEENELLIGSVESGLYTRITQTASELRREAHNESASLRSIISQTAESIRQTVEDDVNSLRTQIVQTAESIRQEVTNEAASLRSSITQTAESIRQEVANEAASLRSSITQQAGRIDLVVSGSGASAAIRLSAIVDGINQSQLELNADRVMIGTGSGKSSVKVYVDGKINATEASITSLKTGTTKATLINSDSVVADYLSATQALYAPNVSIGSGGQGGSGTLYYRGFTFYRQGLTLGGAGGSIAEAHFLGDSSAAVNIDHYHKITATEGTGTDAGKIIITLSDPVATSDTTNSKTNFNIAATTAYQNGVLAARNAVKVNPFTANAVTGATPDHRTFTYETDAPTPDAGTNQADTWYLAGGTSWNNNKTSVGLHYGSASGTTYALLEVDASSLVTAAGYTGRAAVGLADPAADPRTTLNSTRTFTVSTTGRTNSSGAADNLSKEVPLHLYAGDFGSNNKATVYLKWGASAGSSGTNYAQVDVDASTLVTNAGYAGRAAVTLNDPTWNAVSGEIGSSRTLSVTTSGRTNASGTTDNLTKSASLSLSASGLTVYLKHGGANVAKTTCSDANLVAGNIKSGVTIFGVTGTCSPESHIVQANRTVTYTSNGSKTLNPSSGYDVMQKATITVSVPDPDITYPSAASSSSSSGTYDKNYSVSTGYKYHRFKVTAGSKSKTFQITLLGN